MKIFSIKINGKFYTNRNYNDLLNSADPLYEEFINEIIQFLKEWSNNNNFIEVKTSGSTGKPKSIRLLKSAMKFSAISTCAFFNLNKQSSVLLCLPVKYIAGKMMLVRAIVCGFNLHLNFPQKNPFLNINYRIDFVALTPYQFRNSIETIKSKEIRDVIVGGAPFPSDLKDEIKDASCNIYETYGMTETCSHVALKKVNGSDSSEYFTVLPGIHITANAEQCLKIFCSGFSKNPIITNDIVEIENTSNFRWIGRKDNVINSGGIKIFPEKIENKLMDIIDAKFYITSVKDFQLNEKVVLVIEGKNKEADYNKMLIDKIKSVLLPYEVPKEIKFIKKFKLTGSGKIIRNSFS